MTRDELLKRLADADIAFAEVNTMDDLAQHPHLRRIEVNTPNGVVSYPAPAAIVVGEPRHYGAVPAIGERAGRTSRETFHADQGLMSEKPDLDHLRQWIGRSTEASDTVTAQLVKGLRATLFLPIGEPQDRRRRALHRALVSGAAGGSGFRAWPRRSPGARRIPAAGAAATADVGGRRTGIHRHLTRWR